MEEDDGIDTNGIDMNRIDMNWNPSNVYGLRAWRGSLLLGVALLLLLLTLGPLRPAEAEALSFKRVTTEFPQDSAPNSIAAGYLNSDSIPDVAGTEANLNEIAIATFDFSAGYELTYYDSGDVPEATAVGDVNGDGSSDVVVANFGSEDVTILLNDGTGTFTEPTYSPVALPPGSRPNAVAIGETSHDGVPEIVTANSGSDTVSVLQRDAGGYTATDIPVGDAPIALAIADMDGDGNVGIITANQGSGDVSILLSDGAGGFQEDPRSPIAVGPAVASLAAGDLNDDANPDLVVGNEQSKDVTVLLNDGSGGLTEAANSPFSVYGEHPRSVAIADMNGDGEQDIVSANQATSDVSVLLGGGNGEFQAATGSPFPTGAEPVELVVTDFFLDGVPDLITVSPTTDTVSALLNRGWPKVTTSTSMLTFGTGPVGTITGGRVLTVKNTGRTPLHVDRVRTTGEMSDEFLISSDGCTGEAIPAGTECQIGVRFAPLATGTRRTRLEIRSDAPTGTDVVALRGIGGVPPQNRVAPAMSGDASIRSNVACSTGTWRGTIPQTYRRQWLRDGTVIPNATDRSYLVRRADEGHGIRCRVTSRNVAGTASALSNAIRVG
jgi:hypothetical protein